jgi:hypothetical protein
MTGWVRGGVIDIMPGSNITIDKTDPEYPIITSTGGGAPGDSLWQIDTSTPAKLRPIGIIQF